VITLFLVGFKTHGVFAYSRHLNFFGEFMQWWSFYIFSVAASGVWLNWTILGAFLLTLLFQGSTAFTEWITLKKYPRYAEYQKTTSALIRKFSHAPISICYLTYDVIFSSLIA
jgi:steroid 5-alpha reductase family enzyme